MKKANSLKESGSSSQKKHVGPDGPEILISKYGSYKHVSPIGFRKNMCDICIFLQAQRAVMFVVTRKNNEKKIAPLGAAWQTW